MSNVMLVTLHRFNTLGLGDEGESKPHGMREGFKGLADLEGLLKRFTLSAVSFVAQPVCTPRPARPIRCVLPVPAQVVWRLSVQATRWDPIKAKNPFSSIVYRELRSQRVSGSNIFPHCYNNPPGNSTLMPSSSPTSLAMPPPSECPVR